MAPQSAILLGVIRRLRRPTPLSNRLPAKHGSHRAHWIGWLDEYEGPGYYSRRKPRQPRSARFIYEHLHCAPMVIWLAEAAGVPHSIVARAADLAVGNPATYKDSPRSARIAREELPWLIVLAYLRRRAKAAEGLWEN